MRTRALLLFSILFLACTPDPVGLRRADPGSGAEVRFDLSKRPLPDIPFPNDIATRYDPTSPTGLRVNASTLASTQWETHTRNSLDQLDGWGTYSPITVSFSAPLDVEPIFAHHRDDFDFSDDVVYVIDISPDSPDFCQAVPLDMGMGNMPLYLEKTDYYPNDPRNSTNQLVFEEAEEDLNHNGVLDPGEDTDMDGVLDHPNVRFPGADPVNDLLTFYERESNTLILRPLMPLREETKYAVVLTRRLVDQTGRPVRSPFEYINHAAQTKDLAPLPQCLPNYGLRLDDVAFTWSFTTQSISRDFVAIRDGLHGIGPMAWLANDYPPELSNLFDLRTKAPGITNLKIVPEDQFLSLLTNLMPLLVGGGSAQSPMVQSALASHKFIAYHIVGQFESPQFFPRAPDGVDDSNPQNWLPLYDQTWRVDPIHGRKCQSVNDTNCTYVRPEKVTFWITVPKPEYSRRPAPVVIIGHGYTGNKLDPILYGGYFARHGLASIGMECVSHGIGLDSVTQQLVEGIFAGEGLGPDAKALLTDRAYDQNGDGTKDSGADFWTSYVFHTRDVVRQSAVDYMRLVQILRGFDGSRRWQWDPAGTGAPGLAGDFDGDGQVDVGGDAPITMTGGSLGGIMSSVMGGIEPQISAVVPISGGGGLSDIGIRSIQGGVIEAVNLRMMGPLFLSQVASDGTVQLWEYLPDLNGTGKAQLGAVSDPLNEGDTMIVRNLNTGDYECARVQAGKLFRGAVAADQGDAIQLEFYGGALPPGPAPAGCEVPSAVQPRTVISALGQDVTFQAQTYKAGTPITALGDGFGIRRGTPAFRSFMQIAQLGLDPADPVNFAPNFERHRLVQYGTGELTGTRAIVVSTIGDMHVPMNTGASIARAAGFVDFVNKDPRWNKTPNRVLLDTYSLEAAERAGRHVNAEGQSVEQDVEWLSNVTPTGDGWDVPRLNPPMRMIGPSTRVGGITGALFPMSNPKGQHGFNPPDPSQQWDLGAYMVNFIGHYLTTGGEQATFDGCQANYSCDWIPAVPP